MILRPNRGTIAKRTGFSLVEMLIVVAIFTLISVMIVSSMIFYARALKGIRVQQRFQKDANLFKQDLTNVLSSASDMVFVSNDKIIFRGVDSLFTNDESGNVIYDKRSKETTLEYIDGDNNTETLDDNRLVLFEKVTDFSGNVVESRERIFIDQVSRMRDSDGDLLPVFQELTDGGRNHVELFVRIGDRSYEPSDDDRYTGPGYQGLILRQVIVPHNKPEG